MEMFRERRTFSSTHLPSRKSQWTYQKAVSYTHLLIITNVTSCSAVFLQNVITYTGTSYLSSDQAIREAELYYTQLEANLQERINNMDSEEPGHEEYRYNIGPIEHDPFILISYLSAKYEEFTFEQVKPCLLYTSRCV